MVPCFLAVSAVPHLQLAFLLPPNHGLNLEAAAISLMDIPTMQLLTKGPVPLRSFNIQPCSQPPPAGLVAGLHALLCEAAASTTSCGSGGPAERPATAARAARCTSVAGGSGGLKLSSGLQLRRLAEYADRFELELGVEERLGGAVSSSRLALSFPGATPGGACQQFEVRLGGCQVVDLRRKGEWRLARFYDRPCRCTLPPACS